MGFACTGAGPFFRAAGRRRRGRVPRDGRSAADPGIGPGRVQLVLNRSTAYTGITVKNAESALRQRIAFQVVNDYRVAITALHTGAPFTVTRTDAALGKSVVEFVRQVDKLDLSRAETVEAVPATT